MTDSGTSPFIVLPVWLAFKIGGVGLATLRVPIALLAGLAVPLLWLVGRRLAGTPVATLAALFMALTPSYLLYARTATLVGLSVTFALATTLLLFRVLQRPGSWWALIGLQAFLCLDTYGYAPLRFLWPLSLALIAWELLWRRREWRWFAPALLVTALVLPVMVTATRPAVRGASPQSRHPLKALEFYYNAGGEQIQKMNRRVDNYEPFLRDMPPRGADGTYQASRLELARQLVGQNAADFANLLLDRGTSSALPDYWKPEGRLYSILLVPFFLLGLGRVAWRCWCNLPDRVLLALFLGFGLPMLLTSRVHIGRLLFFLPFLLLIVGIGVTLAASWLAPCFTAVAHRAGAQRNDALYGRAALIALSAILVLGVARSAWRDYTVPPMPRKEADIVASLDDLVPVVSARGGALVLVLDNGLSREMEELALGEYQVTLYDRYHFVDLQTMDGPLSPTTDRPTLYYGNPMAHLDRLLTLPNACMNLYYVAPPLSEQFAPTAARLRTTCGQPPTQLLLPE
jgi:4-amino-4-deoxy-L-arabinose transferase-like glycosyltransferase